MSRPPDNWAAAQTKILNFQTAHVRRFRPTPSWAQSRLTQLYRGDSETVHRAGERVGTVTRRPDGSWLAFGADGRSLGRHETRLRAYAEVLRAAP